MTSSFIFAMALLGSLYLGVYSGSINGQDCPEGLPFLGIGLGYNQYSVSQISELAGQDSCSIPLVYNWGWRETVQDPANFPHLDFPQRFVPMVYGCGVQSLRTLQNDLISSSYEGALLVFNEPERADQANCLPDTATHIVEELHRFRLNYEQNTGRKIELIIGGVAEPELGIDWFDQFQSAYIQQYGSDPLTSGIADGIHFHLYPRFAYDNGAHAFDDVHSQMLQWEDWLASHPLPVWITELGVLNAPYQPISSIEYASFLTKAIPYLFEHPLVDHLFIFTLNSQSDTPSSNFIRTALIVDGEETLAYSYVRTLCSSGEVHYCTPVANGRRSTHIDGDQARHESGYIKGSLRLKFPARDAISIYSRPNYVSYAEGYADQIDERDK